MINNKPMTYKEIERSIRQHNPKGIRPEVMKFTNKGIYVVGTVETIHVFDTFMDRFVPTLYDRCLTFYDSCCDISFRTYRRNG